MGSTESVIILAAVVEVLGLILLMVLAYFLIKSAVKAGIKAANKESGSDSNVQIKQTRIISEIARTCGVSEEKIQAILQQNG